MRSVRQREQTPAPQGWRIESAEDIARGFLSEARWEAQQNLNDTLFDLPVPPGAVEVDHWEDDGTDHWTRVVWAQTRELPRFGATVYISGVQTTDGSVTWSLCARVEDSRTLTADQTRQVAAFLCEAADELDGLT